MPATLVPHFDPQSEKGLRHVSFVALVMTRMLSVLTNISSQGSPWNVTFFS
jgi:hypothetical protein